MSTSNVLVQKGNVSSLADGDGDLKLLSDDEPDWIELSNKLKGRHSPFDCRTAWIENKKIDSDEKKTPPKLWTVPEIMKFWEIWKKEGMNWPLIAQGLHKSGFERRTPEHCSSAFIFLVKKAQELDAAKEGGEMIDMDQTYAFPPNIAGPRFRWLPEHVQALEKLVKAELDRIKKLEQAGMNKNNKEMIMRWGDISKQLNIGANPLHCRSMWYKIASGNEWNKPIEMRGRMTSADIERLVEVVNEKQPMSSLDWDKIQEQFPLSSRRRIRPTWFKASLQNFTESSQQMNRLERAVLEHGEFLWKPIADEVMAKSGTFTTGAQCKAAWDTRKNLSNPIWDAEEEKKLLQATEEQSRKAAKVNKSNKGQPYRFTIKDWIDIGKLFYPSKTSVQCRAKWMEIKQPDVQQNEDIVADMEAVPPPPPAHFVTPGQRYHFIWSVERTKVLVAAVEKYGSNHFTFEHVARQLGCTPKSCRARWLRYSKTNQLEPNKYAWDERRKQILLDTVNDFKQKGRSFSEAFHHAATLIGDCSPTQASRAWTKLRRQQVSQEGLDTSP